MATSAVSSKRPLTMVSSKTKKEEVSPEIREARKQLLKGLRQARIEGKHAYIALPAKLIVDGVVVTEIDIENFKHFEANPLEISVRDQISPHKNVVAQPENGVVSKMPPSRERKKATVKKSDDVPKENTEDKTVSIESTVSNELSKEIQSSKTEVVLEFSVPNTSEEIKEAVEAVDVIVQNGLETENMTTSTSIVIIPDNAVQDIPQVESIIESSIEIVMGNEVESSIPSTEIIESETVSTQGIETATLPENTQPTPSEPEVLQSEITEIEVIQCKATEAEVIPSELKEPVIVASEVVVELSEEKTPETIPTDLTAPEIIPSEINAPEIIPSEVIAPEIIPSEVDTPEIIPSEINAPELLPSEVIEPELIPSEVTAPEVIPSEVETLEIIPLEVIAPVKIPSEVIDPEIIPSEHDNSDVKIETDFKEQIESVYESDIPSETDIQTILDAELDDIPEEPDELVLETPSVSEESKEPVEVPAEVAEVSVPEPEVVAPVEPAPAIVEEPPAIVEEPAAIVEEPAAIVEEPAAIVEEPAAIVEEPAAIVEEPAAIVTQPLAIVEEAPAVIEEEKPKLPPYDPVLEGLKFCGGLPFDVIIIFTGIVIGGYFLADLIGMDNFFIFMAMAAASPLLVKSVLEGIRDM